MAHAPSPTPPDTDRAEQAEIKFVVRNLSLSYGGETGIDDVCLDIRKGGVTAFIGPSGCGKTTMLRCLNRMNDLIDNVRITGSIKLDGEEVAAMDPVLLRSRVGMVFQKPNPFPKSIFENIAYGLRIHEMCSSRKMLQEQVENALQRVGLIDEVRDRLDAPGTILSGGQQQRLCIARAIAIDPEVLLMDEPCSALDPIATARVESLINTFSADRNITIIIVSHSMQQALRISERTAYFHLGRLIETGDTRQVLTNPVHEQTHDFVTGRIG